MMMMMMMMTSRVFASLLVCVPAHKRRRRCLSQALRHSPPRKANAVLRRRRREPPFAPFAAPPPLAVDEVEDEDDDEHAEPEAARRLTPRSRRRRRHRRRRSPPRDEDEEEEDDDDEDSPPRSLSGELERMELAGLSTDLHLRDVQGIRRPRPPSPRETQSITPKERHRQPLALVPRERERERERLVSSPLCRRRAEALSERCAGLETALGGSCDERAPCAAPACAPGGERRVVQPRAQPPAAAAEHAPLWSETAALLVQHRFDDAFKQLLASKNAEDLLRRALRTTAKLPRFEKLQHEIFVSFSRVGAKYERERRRERACFSQKALEALHSLDGATTRPALLARLAFVTRQRQI